MRIQTLISDPALEAALVTITLLVGIWAAWLSHSIRRDLETHDRSCYDHLSHSELMTRYTDTFGGLRLAQKRRLVLIARIALGLCAVALLLQTFQSRPA